MPHLPLYALFKIVLWWQRGRHFCLFENCLLKNLLLVRVSSTFLHLQTSYALQFSSASPLAMQKVRVAALRGLVCPPSSATARAVGFDASSRSSSWRRRAHLASRSSSPSEVRSLLINFYTVGQRIVSLHKENHTCLIKHPDFGPILPLQIRPRDPFGRPHLGPFSARPFPNN